MDSQIERIVISTEASHGLIVRRAVEKSAFIFVTAVTLSLKQNQELVTSTSQNAAAGCPILRTLIAKGGMQTVRQPPSWPLLLR
jgi:hypothetical protein